MSHDRMHQPHGQDQERQEDLMHDCNVPYCDGTDLGHDLAREFPEETAQYEEAMDRLRKADREERGAE